MEQELKQALKKDKTAGYKGKWERDAIPSVRKRHQEWCKENPLRTRYLAEIQSYILEKEKISPELHDQLHTEIYLANHQEDKEKEAKLDAEMLAKGFLKIPKSTMDKPRFEYRGSVEVIASKSMDWFTSRIATVGKIITDGRGEAFFIPKGKRSRGYAFQLLDGYYKTI